MISVGRMESYEGEEYQKVKKGERMRKGGRTAKTERRRLQQKREKG